MKEKERSKFIYEKKNYQNLNGEMKSTMKWGGGGLKNVNYYQILNFRLKKYYKDACASRQLEG